MTILTIKKFVLTIEKTILETCDIWDTDYNSDNREPELKEIFVTWQLIVTLDSIRNSCDVFISLSWTTFIGINPMTDWKLIVDEKQGCQDKNDRVLHQQVAIWPKVVVSIYFVDSISCSL